MQNTDNQQHHGPGYRLFVIVWGVLMVLTAVTVWVAGIDLGFFNVLVALTVATSKALLVVLFFMHLKYEYLAFKLMVLITFVILAIFIGMTFFDTGVRY